MARGDHPRDVDPHYDLLRGRVRDWYALASTVAVLVVELESALR